MNFLRNLCPRVNPLVIEHLQIGTWPHLKTSRNCLSTQPERTSLRLLICSIIMPIPYQSLGGQTHDLRLQDLLVSPLIQKKPPFLWKNSICSQFLVPVQPHLVCASLTCDSGPNQINEARNLQGPKLLRIPSRCYFTKLNFTKTQNKPMPVSKVWIIFSPICPEIF